MELTKPYYFDSFRCIAGQCPDSCCKEWAVQVDDTSAAFYRSLPGDLGDRLRQVLTEEDGDTILAIENGRCPMWRIDGLCRIQAELGEQALCKTCREFPRLTHDYGDFIEQGLELSCPEAARLILGAEDRPWVTARISGGEVPEYDEEAMASLKATREMALSLLGQRDLSMGQLLACLLLYGTQAQAELDGEEAGAFDPVAELDFAQEIAGEGDFSVILDFFLELEILTPQWRALLEAGGTPSLKQNLRPLLRYLIERYWLQAVSDYDLYCRVKFIVVFCLVADGLDAELAAAAQLLSKEIENNIDNVEALLDAAYTHPAFTDGALLGLLVPFFEGKC